MTDTAKQYENLNSLLAEHDIAIDAAELHGAITGMLAGGMTQESIEWRTVLQDFINSGDAFPQPIQNAMFELHQHICESLKDIELGFAMLIPDEEAPIGEQAVAMGQWVQGFLAGFAINNKDLSLASEDVRELISDFSELAMLDTDLEDDSDNVRAMFEIEEYVRISVMICFNEFGARKPADTAPKTLH